MTCVDADPLASFPSASSEHTPGLFSSSVIAMAQRICLTKLKQLNADGSTDKDEHMADAD